ncbi:alpha-1B-glycoprotein-like [Rhynchocyon petersi]
MVLCTDIETKPILWAEAQTLQEPWNNVTLVCQARVDSLGFQLLKDGVVLESVSSIAPQHQFPVGALTAETQGLYRCQSNMGRWWTQLSNLVELPGPDSLAPPTLSAELVSWVTPEHNTTLVCQGWLRGVTFLLRREGDDEFLQAAEAPEDIQATFSINRAGNYSCSYRTHAAGQPSAPSAPVSIEGLEVPPAPTLSLREQDTGAQMLGDSPRFQCIAPLHGINFQLRRGEDKPPVTGFSTSPGRVYFSLLGSLAPADSGLYTCRYQISGHLAWSRDSAPVELLISDETLPAPLLQAEPSGPLQPGAHVTLQCQAPRPGLRFVLERQGPLGRQGLQRQSPEGTVAHFELRDVSVLDSGNYSCIYVDPEAPFAGSKRSAHVELRVDGPLPKPQLRALWQGPVRSGRDAALRCESPESDVTYMLLHDGKLVEGANLDSRHRGEMVLTYVGPQHAGIYRCKYQSWGPNPLESELSDPVELQVAGFKKLRR